MVDDIRERQRQLREMEMRYKLEARAEKRKMKEEKQRMKLMKKQEKMEKKLMKQGRMTPQDLKMLEASAGEKSVEDGRKIAKAEVVEFKAMEWKRKSVHSLDEVEKKIDRFSGRGVSGLSKRYRERYGEDLKVPELYQIETSIEMEKEYDRIAREGEGEGEEAESKETLKSVEGKETKPTEGEIKTPETKVKPELNFFDFSTGLLYLTKKFGSSGGTGKKIVFMILDLVVLIVLFPISILRLITTIYFVMKRRKAQKAGGTASKAAPPADA